MGAKSKRSLDVFGAEVKEKDVFRWSVVSEGKDVSGIEQARCEACCWFSSPGVSSWARATAAGVGCIIHVDQLLAAGFQYEQRRKTEGS
jgi:hypothetical protein